MAQVHEKQNTRNRNSLHVYVKLKHDYEMAVVVITQFVLVLWNGMWYTETDLADKIGEKPWL